MFAALSNYKYKDNIHMNEYRRLKEIRDKQYEKEEREIRIDTILIVILGLILSFGVSLILYGIIVGF